jgi:hypothetical protein
MRAATNKLGDAAATDARSFQRLASSPPALELLAFFTLYSPRDGHTALTRYIKGGPPG